jgi:selenocysteine lyase/cysteine desulfurase
MWGKYDLLEALPAYKVRPSNDYSPWRWETGTPSFETIAGTMAALYYMAEIGEKFGQDYQVQLTGFSGRRLDFKTGMQTIGDYEQELLTELIAMLQAISGLEIAGITDPKRYNQRVPTVVFSMDGHSPEQIAQHLAENHIYLWHGNYYALAIMERLGKQESGGMVRVGLAHYNTMQEVERLGDILGQLVV